MNTDRENRLPAHVAIIMDGNGRWAQERRRERFEGHRAGVESVRAAIEAAIENKVEYLSLYAFSEENWGRPKKEVSTLMSLMRSSINNESATLMQHGVRFLVLGNRSRLSAELNRSIDALERKSAGNTVLTLVVFLSYSGRWDILQAARRLAARMIREGAAPEEAERLEEADFNAALSTAGIPDPDLILRTAGEKRISNFLLWQGAYSELVYADVLWPDFRKEHFRAALQEYARRERRFGKV